MILFIIDPWAMARTLVFTRDQILFTRQLLILPTLATVSNRKVADVTSDNNPTLLKHFFEYNNVLLYQLFQDYSLTLVNTRHLVLFSFIVCLPVSCVSHFRRSAVSK